MRRMLAPYNNGEDKYSIIYIKRETEENRYVEILHDQYKRLGFDVSKVSVGKDSQKFYIEKNGSIVAIGALRRVKTKNYFFEYIEELKEKDPDTCHVCEVNNVVVINGERGGYTLAVLMYECAKWANANGFEYIVGLTRYQALRHFVSFGILPVDHPPVSILKKEHLKDFIIYYDTQSPSSIFYMHERARKYFYQEQVMKGIRNKYIKKELQNERR